jgi:orotate phosphoribosyltransferase
MGGGVGCLHELTTAIWYAGNVRPVPIILLGRTACRLDDFLREERWLYTSPTRSLDFVHRCFTAPALHALLAELLTPRGTISAVPHLSLEERIRIAAYVDDPYQLADGTTQSPFFDPFRLASQQQLSHELAEVMATLVSEHVDVVVGLALGGVVLATHIAVVLHRPLLIVRSAPKTYGRFTQLEGAVREGDSALLVDDVVRSGEHMLRAAHVLADHGLVVQAAACVVERTDAGRSRLEAHGIALASLMVDHAT